VTSISAKCKQLRQPRFLMSERTSGHPCLERAKVPTVLVWDSVLGPLASSIRSEKAAMCEEYTRFRSLAPHAHFLEALNTVWGLVGVVGEREWLW